jgi:hypothetical protein
MINNLSKRFISKGNLTASHIGDILLIRYFRAQMIFYPDENLWIKIIDVSIIQTITSHLFKNSIL